MGSGPGQGARAGKGAGPSRQRGGASKGTPESPVRTWLHWATGPVLAVAAGVLSLLAVVAVKDFTALADQELGAQDRVQQIFADTRAPKTAPPILLVDLSQADQRRMGYPVTQPRDVLARLLRLTTAGSPRLVILDTDISWTSAPEAEAELAATLKDVAGKGRPPVLLIRQPLARGEAPGSDAEGPMPDVVMATPYDDVVAGSSNLAWASALGRDDSDGILRRYYTNSRVCQAGHTVRLPGVQVASCVALSGSGDLARLRAQLDEGHACAMDDGPAKEPSSRAALPVPCGGRSWSMAAGRDAREATSRITYAMRWRPPAGHARPQMVLNGQSVEEVERIDALDLLQGSMAPDPSLFRGKVVIIGSSADQLRDVHRTSIGQMPGMMVIANGVRTALEKAPSDRNDLWVSAGIVAVMSLVTCAVWATIRRVTRFSELLMKEIAAPAMALSWFFILSLLTPGEHILVFVITQSVVLLVLSIVSAARETGAHKATAKVKARPHVRKA